MEQKYNARFLGANTPEGFISLFDELYDPAEDWRAYIIKGGPGTGKSRLMRRVADELEQAGYTAQRVLKAKLHFGYRVLQGNLIVEF